MSDLPSSSSKWLQAGKAVLVGQLMVNVPVLIIMGGITGIGLLVAPRFWFAFLLGSFVIAWQWWKFSVERWQQWAIRQGAPAKESRMLAIATGLVWPRLSDITNNQK